MPVPKWCRSRYTFFAVPLHSGWLSIPRIGLEALLWAALLTYMAWAEGLRRFVTEILPGVVILTVMAGVVRRFRGLFEGIRGSLLLLLTTAAAVLLWSLVRKLIGVGGNGDGTREETVQGPDTGAQTRP